MHGEDEVQRDHQCDHHQRTAYEADQRPLEAVHLFVDQPGDEHKRARCKEMHHCTHPAACNGYGNPLQQAHDEREDQSRYRSEEERANEDRHIRHVVLKIWRSRENAEAHHIHQHQGHRAQQRHLNQPFHLCVSHKNLLSRGIAPHKILVSGEKRPRFRKSGGALHCKQKADAACFFHPDFTVGTGF